MTHFLIEKRREREGKRERRKKREMEKERDGGREVCVCIGPPWGALTKQAVAIRGSVGDLHADEDT